MSRYLVLIILFCITGCSSVLKPDLKRLYAHSDSATQQNPVILVHGAFGGRLRDKESKQEVWPGGLLDILWHDYHELALTIDENTLLPKPDIHEAYAITEKVAGRDFYGQIIKVLERAGRYQRLMPGQLAGRYPRAYYVFHYDWRQDNVLTARKLDALIEQIRRDHNNPHLKVDIIAHSMGGLVTRYYMRYGLQDVLDDNEFPVNYYGAQKVHKAILVGTPSLGAVIGLRNFIQGFEVGFDSIPPEALATFPAAYQLLPHPIRNWMITNDGHELKRDLFDSEVWQRFQWSIYNPTIKARIYQQFDNVEEADRYYQTLTRYFHKHLERGRRFVWSLTVKLEQPPMNYIVVGGNCELTPARILVEEVNGISEARYHPSEVTVRKDGIDYDKLMLEPGDGSVTKPSLLARVALDPSIPRHRYSDFPLDYSLHICESHDKLTGNMTFQDNLLNILLSADRP